VFEKPEQVKPMNAPLEELSAARSRVTVLLGEQRRWWWGNRPRVQHPELRKTVERIGDRLRVLSEAGVDASVRDPELKQLVSEHSWITETEQRTPPTLEQSWAMADALRALWIHSAAPKSLAPYVAAHPISIQGSPDDDELRQHLAYDHQQRRERGTHTRARIALRTRYLQRVGRILWCLVAIALLVALGVSEDAGGLLLASIAGATGGTLSGARSLRDSSDIREARGFQAWWWVQPGVGAAVGLFLYALLTSAIVTLPGTDPADTSTRTSAIVVYAFVAGFSEPFVLGVIAKITGAADAAANAAAGPPVPKGASTS
jgi:hypothetical protein